MAVSDAMAGAYGGMLYHAYMVHVVWCMYGACCMMHVWYTCMPHARCLCKAYMVHACTHVHIACMLHLCCMYVACMLHECCMNVA